MIIHALLFISFISCWKQSWKAFTYQITIFKGCGGLSNTIIRTDVVICSSVDLYALPNQLRWLIYVLNDLVASWPIFAHDERAHVPLVLSTTNLEAASDFPRLRPHNLCDVGVSTRKAILVSRIKCPILGSEINQTVDRGQLNRSQIWEVVSVLALDFGGNFTPTCDFISCYLQPATPNQFREGLTTGSHPIVPV
ncbi:hypothetical protein PENTCL1PPCAC_4951 [Pristionchus entomophagus]|uniref:Uncharacterized protein n=1 Tax=Pristionchus entomophagus TaxID=358040 RepID=A0AAV5STB7_9BILA|nr:hypothetical protein PENTCL1PPCAC_4951 [Pristionchus entomophagus]